MDRTTVGSDTSGLTSIFNSRMSRAIVTESRRTGRKERVQAEPIELCRFASASSSDVDFEMCQNVVGVKVVHLFFPNTEEAEDIVVRNDVAGNRNEGFR